MQLLGTTNCTLCFSGCVQCSNSDPNLCLDCGLGHFLPASNTFATLCTNCQTGCKSCSGTADNCQSCEVGFWPVDTSCVAIPANCVGLGTNSSQCTGCFVGYVLSGNSCAIDLSCNSTACEVCPVGFYLVSNKCLACSLSSNCVACEASKPTLCSECSAGFFVDSNFTCSACTKNCSTCETADFCIKASAGFFVKISFSGESTGNVTPCLSPCTTCAFHEDFCLSCATGFSLYGLSCRQNRYLIVIIILGPGSSNSSIFSASDSNDMQLFLGIRSINRLGNSINDILPAGFKDSRGWRRRLRFSKFATGSIQSNFSVEAGSYTDRDAAKNDLSNALANNPIDGTSYVSSSVTSEGFSDSSSDSTNLGLILGLAIGIPLLSTFCFIQSSS